LIRIFLDVVSDDVTRATDVVKAETRAVTETGMPLDETTVVIETTYRNIARIMAAKTSWTRKTGMRIKMNKIRDGMNDDRKIGVMKEVIGIEGDVVTTGGGRMIEEAEMTEGPSVTPGDPIGIDNARIETR
jgi:hypothetical protein